RGDQNSARFGLPPGVNNGAATFAYHLVIPAPRFGVDRLTDSTQKPQGLARRRLDRPIAFAHQRPDSRWRGVENRYLMLVHRLPEARSIGIAWHAFKHHCRGAISQWAINNVSMSGNPAYIGGAPEYIVLTQIEDGFMRIARIDQVAATAMHDPFGLARAA